MEETVFPEAVAAPKAMPGQIEATSRSFRIELTDEDGQEIEVKATASDPITICEIWNEFGLLSYGIARCREDDFFVPEIGLRYALRSALGRLSRYQFSKESRKALWDLYFTKFPYAEQQTSEEAWMAYRTAQVQELKRAMRQMLEKKPEAASFIQRAEQVMIKQLGGDAWGEPVSSRLTLVHPINRLNYAEIPAALAKVFES
jgi:hypothetical protein